MPGDLAAEIARVTSVSQGKWAAARKADYLAGFLPVLGQVIDLRRAKPIDPNSLNYFARNHHTWHVWEDAQAINGVGQALGTWLLEHGYSHIALHRHGYWDRFADHAPRESQIKDAQR